MSTIHLGPVVYEPPLTRSGPWHAPGHGSKALRTGPRWLRGATRWHRIRSGVQYEHLDHPSYSAWCGQSVSPKGRDTTVDLPVDGIPLCGTCEGRAAGAGHPTPLDLPADVALLFRPSRLVAPRWCPGGGPYGPAQHLAEVVGHRVVRCAACSDLVAERSAYGWNARFGQPRQHTPGPGLVPGCEQHAWRHLVRTVEGVACECAGLERAA
ncbi:hypothetical protein [Nocardioides sp.]|uniref:hypothetical protein n=1 Tax=Nocardioides sp. TaxID=35761 RepID=UPI003562010D